MDDYNVSVLSEAKNEYSLRLVTILYPLVLEGIKSILKEAWELCLTNDEEEKYLMTFQNFLSRVTKWNQTIIDEETARILAKSGCPYLEDLLTCVHITQLKILTSIRVSQKQKKIELDIPKLADFIHRIYIRSARKFYSNVYLFEQKILPLQYQKNMRECETICKECILNVIRDNMPVEHILRSYMDESIEEEIIEEDVPQKELDAEAQKAEKAQQIEQVEKVVTNEVNKKKEAEVNVKKEDEVKTADVSEAVVAAPKLVKPLADVPVVATPIKPHEDVPVVVAPVKETADPPAPKVFHVETPIVKAVVKSIEKPVAPVVTAPVETPPTFEPTLVTDSPFSSISEDTKKLSFNDVDKVFDRETLKENLVEAPKTIERLEEISKMRTAQRKAEEAEEAEEGDDDNIKIHASEDANIELDIQQL
jgi:hypothetical protein